MELLYKNEVYEIIGAAIDVPSELGPGFLESVYEEAMCIEATNREIPYQTQVRIPVKYKGSVLQKEFVADFVGYEKFIGEFNSIQKLTEIETPQILSYLQAIDFKLGLLINFGSQGRLEWIRFIL